MVLVLEAVRQSVLEISNPEASLCNHQCVVPMVQKMLPVRCYRKSASITRKKLAVGNRVS